MLSFTRALFCRDIVNRRDSIVMRVREWLPEQMEVISWMQPCKRNGTQMTNYIRV